MEIKPLPLEGSAIMIPRRFRDERGFFSELFRQEDWLKFSGGRSFVQDNFSWSAHGVIRGLHFQAEPAQGKLVTCLFGQITDVLVDIRGASPTFGEHTRVELSSENPMWVWVPPGFAHGFAVTSAEGAAVLYKVDQYFNAKSDRCIRWNDPRLNVKWPNFPAPLVSAKDQSAPGFDEYLTNIVF